MKKSTRSRRESEMRAEYDFSKGIRGKYYQRYREGTNLVKLAPDVLEYFPDSAAVNEALRVLIRVGKNGKRAKATR
jgi:hypothetical protein